MHIQLFISAVSDEFNSYREFLHDDLDRYNVSVKTQRTFVESGHVVMHKLDLYIQNCEAVIHLAGDMTGSLAHPESVAWLRRQYSDLATRFPTLKPALEGTERLSYTQWEAWLALYHDLELYIVRPMDSAKRDPKYVQDPEQQAQQANHLLMLEGVSRHPLKSRFQDARDLAYELIHSTLYDLLQRAGKRHRPQNLPYTTLGTLFKGRDEFMEQLRQSLLHASAGQVSAITGSQALHGLGGIGKTRLAVEYAWKHRNDYSALLCVSAETPQDLKTNLAALCGRLVLNLSEQVKEDEEERKDAVINWLQKNPGWILILDNVDAPEVAARVEKMLAQLGSGHVVITSRISRWSTQVKPLELDTLPVDDAASFLLERTAELRQKTDNDNDIATNLAKELGALALAMEQASAYICTHRLSLKQYANAWQHNRNELMKWLDEPQMQYPRSVAITWLTSFKRLAPAPRRLINRLAWLSPEPIPDDLLNVPVPGGKTRDSSRSAIAMLDRYSLVSYVPGAPMFAVHRLVQDVTRRLMKVEPRQKSFLEALGWVNEAFKETPNESQDWPELELLSPHASQLAQHAHDNNYDTQAVPLHHKLGILIASQARSTQAETPKHRVLPINEGDIVQNIQRLQLIQKSWLNY